MCQGNIENVQKKKDRENARFYKRNRNACMGVYVKIIYSQKEIHLQEEFLRRQGNYLKHRHGENSKHLYH